MAMDATQGAALLKVVYNDDLPLVMQGYDRLKTYPFYARLEKKEKQTEAFGSTFNVAVKIDDPETANYSFSTAQGKSDSDYGQSRYKVFAIPGVVGYTTAKITGPMAIAASMSTQAFVDAMAEEAKGARRRHEMELATMCFKSGTGSRGQITAITSTTITVSIANCLARFRVNMNLVAAVADGTGSLRSATPSRITGINPQTGVITLSVDPTSLTWAVADYLFLQGDFVASTNTKIVGVGAWIPATAPTGSVAFNGVVRDNDWQLYGIIYDATASGDIRQALLDGIAQHQSAGMSISEMYLHPVDWAKLAKLLDPQKHSKDFNDNKYNVGFTGLMLSGSAIGTVPVFQDAGVEPGNCFGVEMGDWYMAYAGPDIVHLTDAANPWVQRDTADAFETRFRSFSNLVCERPGGQLRIVNIT